jgi:hypothetical protein
MSRMKQLTRTENRAAIANLLDLGFTVPAIAYMTGKTDVTIYTLLERMGRKKGRTVMRHDPIHIDPHAFRYVQRVFGDAHCIIPHIWGVARTMASLAPTVAEPVKVKRGNR